LALIKTAWCDHYDGEETVGNFKNLDGGGFERFNMSPTDGSFQIYSIPYQDDPDRPPFPKSGSPKNWAVAQVARDPELGGVKLVGWFENATFIGQELPRTIPGAEGTTYCITSNKAFEIAPEKRLPINHGGRIGSLQYAWLKGDGDDEKWLDVAVQIEAMIEDARHDVRSGAKLTQTIRRRERGDTRVALPPEAGGYVDDGGDVTGRIPGCESDEHKALKAWVEDNASTITGVEKLDSKPEFLFKSLDRADVALWNARTFWPIEVKSWKSGESDLFRGVYQCVKYRALAQAHFVDLGKGNMEIKSVLVVEEDDKSLIKDLREAAMRHEIELFVAPRNRD
jgi:hypothetical protein